MLYWRIWNEILTVLGCDIDVWTFDELRMIVREFKESHESNDEELSCKH
jgi:hypothetical protein